MTQFEFDDLDDRCARLAQADPHFADRVVTIFKERCPEILDAVLDRYVELTYPELKGKQP